MTQSSTYELTDSKQAAEREAGLSIGLVILLVFAFFRPIATSIHHVGSVSILDIFGIGSSYLIILGILTSIRSIQLNLTFLLILFFSFYAGLSMLWGSEYRDLVRMIFPFLPFVLAAAAIKSDKHIKMIIYALILGYVIPILGSSFLIVTGKSEIFMGSSMLERQAGLASGVHTLGHAMLFFSFIYAFYLLLVDREKKSTEFKLVTILFILSLFCMVKSYTRTVLLGAMIFWCIYLWERNKKALVLLIAFGAIVGTLYIADVHNLIWQTRGLGKANYDMNTASSGRLSIWAHNIKIFSQLPSTTTLIGVGLGHELDRVPGAFSKWMGSHNDYMSLTIMLGVLGLLIYLMICGAVFGTAMKSKISRQHKYLYFGLLVSVFTMNFVSNSYIVRFQMAQLLWLFVGMMYACRQMKAQELMNDSGKPLMR